MKYAAPTERCARVKRGVKVLLNAPHHPKAMRLRRAQTDALPKAEAAQRSALNRFAHSGPDEVLAEADAGVLG
eukprot:15453123-Alexandrium_andersonii.AAC.1